MENSVYPIPYSSQSTPASQVVPVENETRPRRHTITRPDSAIALLSDDDDDENDGVEQQETFDRISGILSSLIQEANEAVQGIEKERVHLIKKSNTTVNKRPSKTYSSSTALARQTSEPRRTRKRSSPTTTLPPLSKKSFFRHTSLRTRTCPSMTVPQRRSLTPRLKQPSSVNDSIKQSFARLDNSIALVDSLSRDLAYESSSRDTRLTTLILIPLLHIPHSLITMIFDFCTSSNSAHTNNSFSLSSMIFWACVFTFTNLMVDQVVTTTKRRRLSLPGAFKRKEAKQSQFQPKNQPALKRRNSI